MGPATSGKSCLIKRFVQGYYKVGGKYDPTLGDTYTKNIERNGSSLNITIRDTAGIYHFAAMRMQEGDIVELRVQCKGGVRKTKQEEKKRLRLWERSGLGTLFKLSLPLSSSV
jgi:predicted secreted protein